LAYVMRVDNRCERSVPRGLRAQRLGSIVGDMMRTRQAQGEYLRSAWVVLWEA
jgi:hypothetical protein